MQRRSVLVAATVLVTAAGCGSPGIDRDRSPGAGISLHGPPELKYAPNPPVKSRLKVSDAEVYGWNKVSYIHYDLNGDGNPEYFIVDEHHAHACTFVLIGHDGENMLTLCPEDIEFTSESGDWARDHGFFCCDQMIILASSHESYFDFITIDTDWHQSPMQTWKLWVRKNGRYIAQQFRNELFFYTHDRNGPAPFIGVIGTDDGSHDFSCPRIRAYWSDMARPR